MKNLITKTKYAEMCGLSRRAVYDAELIGEVIFDGKRINLDESINQDFLKKCKDNEKIKSKKTKSKPVLIEGIPTFGKKKENNKKIEKKDQSVKSESLQSQKLRAEIEERNLKIAVRKNELIERELLRIFFGRLYQIHSNQFTALGERLAAEIASICGIEDGVIETQIREKITNEAYRTLQNVKRLADDFLLKNGSELMDV